MSRGDTYDALNIALGREPQGEEVEAYELGMLDGSRIMVARAERAEKKHRAIMETNDGLMAQIKEVGAERDRLAAILDALQNPTAATLQAAAGRHWSDEKAVRAALNDVLHVVLE